MAGYCSVKKTSAGEFMFNLHAGNHEVVLTSESYVAKASALDGIESVRRHATSESNFERETSSAGGPYFVLMAANHEPIGTSEVYSSEPGMERGVWSVVQNAGSATIKDLT